MSNPNLAQFRNTAEFEGLKALLQFHQLIPDQVLSTFFSKIEAKGITSIFEATMVMSVDNRLVNATFKTVEGLIGLRVYAKANGEMYDISYVNQTTNETELLFTVTRGQGMLGSEPAD